MGERANEARAGAGVGLIIALGLGVAALGGKDVGAPLGGGNPNKPVFCADPQPVDRVNVSATQIKNIDSEAEAARLTGIEKVGDINKVEFQYDRDRVEYNDVWDFAGAARDFYDHSVIPRQQDLNGLAGQIVVYKCVG